MGFFDRNASMLWMEPRSSTALLSWPMRRVMLQWIAPKGWFSLGIKCNCGSENPPNNRWLCRTQKRVFRVSAHHVSRFMGLLIVRLPQIVCSSWKTGQYESMARYSDPCSILQQKAHSSQTSRSEAKTPKNKSIERPKWLSRTFELGTSP